MNIGWPVVSSLILLFLACIGLGFITHMLLKKLRTLKLLDNIPFHPFNAEILDDKKFLEVLDYLSHDLPLEKKLIVLKKLLGLCTFTIYDTHSGLVIDTINNYRFNKEIDNPIVK